MFPTLDFQVSGLNPKAMYDIYVEMILVDDHHWKFNNGQWIATEHGYTRHKSSKCAAYAPAIDCMDFFQVSVTRIPIRRTAVHNG